jgi:uncharacterized protein (TIGR02147 family)
MLNLDASQAAASPGPALAAASEAPSIFNYQNYRLFLTDWMKWKKSVQPSYSGAVFAKQAGVSAHTLLGMVCRGERGLGYETIRGFAKATCLRAREALYFEKLVLFNQAKTSEDKAHYFEQVCAAASGSGRDILTQIKDRSAYLSHWYVVAIRELVALPDFSADPEWIARKLKRKISRKQAEEAWEILMKGGLVEARSDGGYVIVSPKLDFDPGTVDFVIRGFHKEYLERAREAIDHEPLPERDLSSFTLSIGEADLEALRARIKEFRLSLNQEFPRNRFDRTRVVAVNTQMLVLTEK